MLIIEVQDNQPTLHQQIQGVLATTAPLGSAYSHDKGRNHDECCTVTVFEPDGKLAATDWYPHVTVIIRVERSVYTRYTKTGLLRHSAETAFYVTNTPVTASRAAEAIRAHWRIETTSHYSRDITWGGVAQSSSRDSGWNSNGGEDRSSICTNPGVFLRLRNFTFNTRKANRADTLSQDRYRAGLAGIENLLRTLAIS